MAYRLNVPVWCVSITPIPQDTQGRTVDESAAAGVEAFAQIMLAGYAACIAAGFDERKAMVGVGEDFNRTRHALRKAYGDDTYEERKQRAVATMSERKNKRAVRVLAKQLVHHRELQFDQIEACIEAADLRCR